ncbi:hypothetical protein MesoLj113b_71910 (plasmid) [Mesorhizobium sp. 113-3-3]|nr:hypothetical protein MesoLj113b_71910 [Mesorhizobium sp. 113-3-3]
MTSPHDIDKAAVKMIPIFDYVFVCEALRLCFHREPFRQLRYLRITYAPAIQQIVSFHPQV